MARTFKYANTSFKENKDPIQLRNRSELKTSGYFKDFVMIADFQENGEENPEIFEEATTSKQAAKWKEI